MACSDRGPAPYRIAALLAGFLLAAQATATSTLAEEKQHISDDIKDVYTEAKAAGFDTKAMKRVIALRKKEKAERDAEEAMVEVYKDALGL